MRNPPLITVVMNCFNGEKYLRQAIDSVIAQTWQNWELIFWDNQSTDRSAEIFRSYSDPRMKYFYAPKHTYLYAGRNYALEKASGEFLAFLDVDDWWEPEKLARQIPMFDDPEVAIVCSNYRVVNELKGKSWIAMKAPPPAGHVLSSLCADYFVALLTLMVRRAALQGLDHVFDSRFHVIGDFDLVLRLAARWKLACVADPIANYRIHGANETGKHRVLQISELETWVEKMAGDPVVSQELRSGDFGARLAYIKGMNELLDGRKAKAFGYLGRIRGLKRRLRFMLLLAVPTKMIRAVKN